MATGLVVAWTMGATALPMAMSQLLVVLPEQVFRTTIFPALTIRMPVPLVVQLLPSTRQSEAPLMRTMPGFPLFWKHWHPRMMVAPAPPMEMPEALLNEQAHPSMTLPAFWVKMPATPLVLAVHPWIAHPPRRRKPPLELFSAAQLIAEHEPLSV